MKHHHLILGYGSLGKAIAEELTSQNLRYSVAQRSGEGVPNFRKVDATNLTELTEATKDVTHLYLALGLPYSTAIWQKTWPVVMANVISAAQQNKCAVIFFDNIYMYGPAPLQSPITEEHPQNPPSKKGLVRKHITQLFTDALEAKQITGVIGRCADFYGPGVANSMLYTSAMQNQLAKKPVQFVGNPHTKHNFTYVPDAARALVHLALDPTSYGQAWHLPTAPASHTTAELLQMSAAKLKVPDTIQVMPKALLPLLQLVVPIIKEVREMTYQTESEYHFSSQKFEDRYPEFTITSYKKGIAAMVDSFTSGK